MSKSKETNKKITNSPIRLAIALLMQNPEIYKNCQSQINCNLLEGKEQELLQKLLQQVEESPGANTATLIEVWRESPYFGSLNKLAGWEHQEPEEELTKKFTDIIIFLQKQNIENKINQYLAKSRESRLNCCGTIIKLQEMLKQRHQIVHEKN